MNTKLNKSDWIILTVIYGITILLNAIDYYKDGSKLIEYFIDFPSMFAISICMILIFLRILIPKFLLQNKNYLAFTLLGLLILTFFGTLSKTISKLSGGISFDEIVFNPIFFQRGLYTATNMISLPFGVLLAKKFYEGQTQYLKIEKQQKENELKILRSQLDPHFLFNNLNTLDALIDSNTTKAKEYINRLSLIYRYLIQTKDSEVMELSEELMLAENYIFLIKTRFGTDYDFTINKQASVNDKFIPTGALQALLENIVKHNKVKNGNTIKTKIVINQNNLTISNKKSNLSSDNLSFGTGLENLKMRYKLLTDKEIVIKNLDNNFSVTIPVINLDA